MPKSKLENRKPSDLHPHAEQAAIFGDLPDEKFSELVAKIKKEGFTVPVDILPDGTIVCGHNRVRAAKRLGMENVPVIVRDDLAEQGATAVLVSLVDDNLVRRQLSPLAQARAYHRLAEATKRYPGRGMTAIEKAELEAKLEAVLGMSGRNMNRYLAVLKTPRAVQDALENGNLSLVYAARVALLPKRRQDELAAEIALAVKREQGVKLNEIVEGYLKAVPARPISGENYRTFLRRLSTGVDALDGNLEKVPRGAFGYAWHTEILQKAAALIRSLTKIEREVTKERGGQE